MDIKDLTPFGWLLLILTVVGALGLGIPAMVLLQEHLELGRGKRIFMALPFLIGGAVFFGGARIGKAMGKSVTKRDDQA